MAKSKKVAEVIYAGLYIRVSSRQQVEEGYSLEAQERALKAYSELMGWTVRGIYRDEGISGKKINRPELQKLLAEVKAGNIQKVVIVKLDRISRNTRDMLNITDELEKHDVALVSIKDNIDTSSATGKLMRTVLSAIAQFESDICEEEAVIVERIYNGYLGGKSAYKIAQELNTEGVRTKREGVWQAKQVLVILGNMFYTGRLEWEGIVSKGEHEAIVSERLYNKVQRLIEKQTA